MKLLQTLKQTFFKKGNYMVHSKKEFTKDYEDTINIDDYFMLEFVAIPQDFEIDNYLSIREQAGMFGDAIKQVDIEQVKKISMSVRLSPVFALLNNPLVKISSCIYFLKVINDLNLIVKSVNNPIRKHHLQYIKDFEYSFDKNKTFYIGNNNIKRINFVICNICAILNEETFKETLNIAQNVKLYQEEIDKKILF